jgi:hypothetical protein
VISPQNGHILCDPKSLRYVCIAKSFLSGPAMKANNLRTRIRKGCMRFTAEMPAFPGRSIGGRQVTRKRTWNNYPSCPGAQGSPLFRNVDRLTMTHQRPRLCARLLNLHKKPFWGASTAVAWPLAERLKAGVRLRSSQLGAEAGDCRLESKA